MIIEKEIRHFHLFCGLGGGAKGFNQGQARVGNLKARFRCVGGIDVDAAAIRDFERLSRKRFLLVARHREKVPPFLYEPERRRLQSVGSVLDRMPLPGDPAGGPMHRVPALQWKTWVRLAFVEAGGDWRTLNRLAVENGVLRDYLIAQQHGDEALTGTGTYCVIDPRFDQSARWRDGQAYGVRRWGESTGAIAGQQSPGQGAYAVADPRIAGIRHNNVFRIVRWDQHAQAVTAGGHPTAGGQAVADPRPPALPRHPTTDAGLPDERSKLVTAIRARDGTWHRPFTTLELAALQSLVDPEEQLRSWMDCPTVPGENGLETQYRLQPQKRSQASWAPRSCSPGRERPSCCRQRRSGSVLLRWP